MESISSKGFTAKGKIMAQVGDRIKLKEDILSSGVTIPAGTEGIIGDILTDYRRSFPIRCDFRDSGYDNHIPCAKKELLILHKKEGARNANTI